ncbi:uncharacterized protein LY89DRAFT_690880 [Mollisia scopiformis]|uniref:Uncharacterized protein n=1 Tax=Mollisia scopiformis TaxID=149040 RepID=A0A132B7K5_MOLSC|nr:uncharacterized protein LY89DRAFT_690880 [Mollisia scopiformis]KUJ08386.1 hypothetical protein LY89DRAFT_690880 [Mollisia scopiformis]
MKAPILPPKTEQLLGHLLASLPAASISPSPPTALLPLLSPILRQRVQLLSASNQEPWLPLLCYDSTKASKLEEVVKNERFEPHPVSGEVEIDWDYDVDLRYKRTDEETLQSLASLHELDLSVKLVWCVNDEIGGGDGWRIGEVAVYEPSVDSTWGQSNISQAEEAYENYSTPLLSSHNRSNGTNGLLTPDADAMDEDEDDDDDYWAQYDNTPARTPAPKDSGIAPMTSLSDERAHHDDDEASYYAQYSSVQPAMDDHDPDEAEQNGTVESSLGRDEIAQELQQSLATEHEHSSASAWSQLQEPNDDGMFTSDEILHPRPGSSTGSSGSDTVAKLEKGAAASAALEQSEVGIKQHIGTSVKSLYRLAKVAGIERGEFERIVRTELDCLGLMDEDL